MRASSQFNRHDSEQNPNAVIYRAYVNLPQVLHSQQISEFLALALNTFLLAYHKRDQKDRQSEDSPG